MSEDSELEWLKQRKLLEMRRRFLKEKALEAEKMAKQLQQTKTKTPEEVLQTMFVGRAWEVWNAAKLQYPKATQEVAKALATLIMSQKVTEPISGEQIYWLFRQLRLPIRLKTRIRILESGELKTIADKLKEE
ncbi:MAG: hypothetical protein JSV20_07160 [Candidatus Bathyarchaeota archaeon]|nr:MAG: hypothetical protein JSV20_07160 [Candidatus Bathyarchaeota archaeon]